MKAGQGIRASLVLALLIGVTVIFAQEGQADADADAAGNRSINLVPSVKGANLFPLKNPGVVTLGTLSILNRIDFAISAYTTLTTNSNTAGGALTYAWDWGDGTPPGSGPSRITPMSLPEPTRSLSRPRKLETRNRVSIRSRSRSPMRLKRTNCRRMKDGTPRAATRFR